MNDLYLFTFAAIVLSIYALTYFVGRKKRESESVEAHTP
jgi:hypothetical protein